MSTKPTNDSNTVVIENGKYAVTGIETGRLEALRHGEPWRELTGDKLVLGLAQEIQELREQLAAKDKLMRDLGLIQDNFVLAAGPAA
ncbi:hypothetical protein AHiyo8_01200 [Arthrobacter sp. Hiyo8]|uniref:hypothetical protein n=1 Tax=Arthrobacter sp. Hiyo1 TaxID=1588020 RepID=UPI000683809B|nr:hypothetical protein [Arthrobacter sp. Hiyo1]BAS11817.1 hypothetical protein AHiyo8_01200 [Arthrobacter sp. Hiyo8]GAP61307.1 hypothetical protein AHiyo1_49960 [Arthrobacter sp. Hiyo1]